MSDDNKMKKHDSATSRGGPPRAVAQLVPRLTEKALGKRGLAHANLIVDWPAIVGPEIANECQPEKLAFPRGERSRGVLHLRASGPVALEVQHDTPRLLERINGYFGYRAVTEIRLIQAQSKTIEKIPKPQYRTPAAAELNALETTLAHVEDAELRETLNRLGSAILSESRKSTKK
ncbi:MAG: DciA family protein [Pseudomonadota bacterium]|nr:DciA family protein [Pseudomonadota bacterium]